MEAGGSSAGPKTKSTRRTWKHKEEMILMEQLKELIKEPGWKTENGFRPGYLNKLEEMVRTQLPGTDIRASPHINSRITIWKRHHGSLQSALGDSGSGFNPITKILDVSDTTWAKAVQKEPSIAGMRYKPWPFYYDWLEVFGCERATGKVSEDVIDAVNELVSDDLKTQADDSVHSDSRTLGDVPAACDMEVESEAPAVSTATRKTSTKKKRAHQSQSDIQSELFKGLFVLIKESDDRIGSIVENLHGLSNNNEPAKDVFTMLDCVPDLSLDERLDASEQLAKNPQRLAMFMGFPEHARPRYIRRLLRGDFDGKCT